MNTRNTRLRSTSHSSQESFSQELFPEAFHFSGVLWLDRSIALALLSAGVALVVSGFVLSLGHSVCGVSRLLLGIAPALAGGYHAYCLEAWRYESHLNPMLLRQRCAILYLLATTLAVGILLLTYCG